MTDANFNHRHKGTEDHKTSRRSGAYQQRGAKQIKNFRKVIGDQVGLDVIKKEAKEYLDVEFEEE